MYVKLGSYTHQLNEVGLRIERQTLLNDAQVPWGVLHRWTLEGLLTADSLSAIDAAIASLESSYASDGNDIYLLDNSQNQTNTKILNSNTIGGVRVVQPPSYREYLGSEYVTQRAYTIVVEAIVRTSITEAIILAWSETLSFQGGGPREVLIETRNGPPQRQTVSQQTPYFMTQTGQAVGLNQTIYALPLLPTIEDRPARRLDIGEPKTYGYGSSRTRREFPASWSYRFQDATEISALPTARPVA